jgi:hypothetical protein
MRCLPTEKHDMFNLDQAIAQWRQQMLDAGIKPPDVLDELESHLRDDVERHTKLGKSTQQAFGIAAQNLGESDALRKEFKKAHSSSRTMEKLMIGVCGVFVGFIVLLSGITVFLCFASWGERTVASAAVVCILVVACGWRYGVPFLPVIADWRLRWGVGLTCVASGFLVSSVFCGVILPHFEVSADHQLPAIGLWAVFLIAVFACAGVGLTMSEREREVWGMRESPLGKTTSAAS